MSAIRIRPITRDDARAFVREHHSHHRRGAAPADVFRLAAELGGERVAVAIMGCATAPALGRDDTWEVTRLCVRTGAPPYTASRLLGACARVMDAAGVQLGVSYTRVDERGSCYRAAGWIAVAYAIGRSHDTGNRAARMLPGLYEPSTEIVDRVRWERGPLAPTREPEVEWCEEVCLWRRRARSEAA